MAENNATATAEKAPSVASIMSKDYAPRTTAGEAKGLAELGYDRTGYISQIDPATFTAPLDQVATTATDDIMKEAAKYADQRRQFRDKQITAQINKEWNNLGQADKDLMTDMYAFSGYRGSQGDFYRQLFDMGGRLTNRQVKDAMSTKLSEYSSQDAFNADAKNSKLFAPDDKNVGMLFGWGENLAGDDTRYRQGRTYRAREASRKEALMAQLQEQIKGYEERLNPGPDRFHAR